jgi:D-3-phosphoglycerate dehydrogenase / 2-oxoglutarate reductase
MARILVTRRLPFPAIDRMRDAGHDVDVWEDPLPPPRDALLERVANAEGLLCMLSDRVDGELLDAAPDLRAVAVYAVGYDNVDLDATRGRGVPVGNTPDVLTDATADLAFALLLAAARRLPEAAAAVRDGEWRTWEPAGWLGVDVHGATLGIVGFGRIGRRAAGIAAAFDMQVRAYDPYVDVAAEYRCDSVEELLAASDFVTLHVPLTAENHHLINADRLALLRPGSVLVNCSRGALIDLDAAHKALQDGRLGGLGLDVYDPEPPEHHPVFDHPNTVLTPHLMGFTQGAMALTIQAAVQGAAAVLRGEKPPAVATP